MKRLTAIALAIGFAASALAEDVTTENFVRAETDHMLRLGMKTVNLGVGELLHRREPATTENQTVIRTNQDTLYSNIVLDLSKPVTVTLPEIGGRYMSMHVTNQDHYMFVETKPGSYELSRDCRLAFRVREYPHLRRRHRSGGCG